MRKRKKIDYREHETAPEGIFPGLSDVASQNECTGLMFRPPMDDGEMDAYRELSPMQTPRGGTEVSASVQAKLHRSRTPAEAGRAVEEASGGCRSAEDPL